MPPESYNAGDEHDVKVAIRATKRWDDKRSRVIITLMGTEDGRRWVRELLETCHIGANPFNRDALAMSFACGELNIGNQLMTQVMNASPEMYMRMMDEARVQEAEQHEEEKD